MADDADIASIREQEERDRALAEARAHARTLPGNGTCLNCGVDVKGDARWCGPDCRDDYERYTRGH